MKKLTQFAILLFATITFAQNASTKGSITGKIIDSQTQETLPYVNVIVKNSAQEIITGGITQDDGTFSIKKIALGKNTIEIQFIGYKTEIFKREFINGNTKFDFGTIQLTEDAAQLDAVVVIAETSTVVQKIDRKVINVGKDLTSAGTTASELLNNVQSVSVDSQTGNLSLRGNENVRVLVDGKPTSIGVAQLLKQIPSASIKQIELITNPSAKYNPEGMSGIINIILHKNSNLGFNGSVNTGITQGENTRFNGSLDMNYKTGKVNFFGNYGFNTGKSDNFGFVKRTGSTPILNQEFKFDSDTDSHLLKVGADFYINDKNTISFYTTQNISSTDADGSTMVFSDNVLVTNSPNFSDRKSNSGTYNLNYELDFDDKGTHNLELEANYSNGDSPEDAVSYELLNPTNPITNFNNSIENDTENLLFNVDYTKPIAKNGKLEVGLEYRTNETANNNISNQFENVYDIFGTIIGDNQLEIHLLNMIEK